MISSNPKHHLAWFFVFDCCFVSGINSSVDKIKEPISFGTSLKWKLTRSWLSNTYFNKKYKIIHSKILCPLRERVSGLLSLDRTPGSVSLAMCSHPWSARTNQPGLVGSSCFKRSNRFRFRVACVFGQRINLLRRLEQIQVGRLEDWAKMVTVEAFPIGLYKGPMEAL